MVKIICIAFAGVLTFSYSALYTLAIFSGFALAPSFSGSIPALLPLFAFPVFLVVFLSLRWAALINWLFLIGHWGIICGFTWAAWDLCLSDSVAEKALLAATTLITLSYLISRIAGNLPSEKGLAL